MPHHLCPQGGCLEQNDWSGKTDVDAAISVIGQRIKARGGRMPSPEI